MPIMSDDHLKSDQDGLHPGYDRIRIARLYRREFAVAGWSTGCWLATRPQPLMPDIMPGNRGSTPDIVRLVRPLTGFAVVVLHCRHPVW